MFPIVIYLFAWSYTFTKIPSKGKGMTSMIISSEAKLEDTNVATPPPLVPLSDLYSTSFDKLI